MSMRTKSLCPTVTAAIGGVAALSMTAAYAQQAVEELETVVVTGSLLKRIESEVALPVTVLDADDVAKAGATNALQTLQLVAQNQSTTISSTSLGTGTGFASYASLRSLGSARTLVLVNGKRMVNNPYQALGVDLNTIPLALIERVEVLSDGASSTYGSDAIAGVINFITRPEFEGLTMSATATQPEADGGGETYQGSIGAGYGTLSENGWNLYTGVTWRKNRALHNASRDFGNSAFRPERGLNRLNATTFPANYSQPASGLNSINPSSPECTPPLALFTGGRACGYDFSLEFDAILPQEQWSYLAKGAIDFGGHVASLEYVGGRNEIVSSIAPSPVIGLTMPSTNPFYPGQGTTPGITGLNPVLPISVSWRVTAAGPMLFETQTVTDRIVGQLEGLVFGWDYQLSALTSSSTVELEYVDGLVALQSLRDGMSGANGAPFLNPFGEQTAEGMQFLRDNRLIGRAQRAEGELTIFGAQASRTLWELPAGPLSLAIAAEYKTEDAEFRNNFDLIRRAPTTGLDAARDATADRYSSSVSMEAIAPVAQGLELGLAVRYDDYNDFGDTVNPKVSLRYQPVEPLLLRASYNTGFRAPTLYDLHAPISFPQARTRQNDPLLCPGGVPNTGAGAITTRDCNAQFILQTGGNQELDAEESGAYSVGFVLQPTRTLSFGVDYWDYHVKQTIGVLGEAAVFSDPLRYGEFIVRCSQVPVAERSSLSTCNVPGGDPIAYVVSTMMNLGDTKTSGFDITAQWTSPDTFAGTFGVNYRGTYVSKYDFQREEDGSFFSRAGEFFDGVPVIRYTHYTAFNWERDAWSARITNRHKAGYDDCNAQCNLATQFFQKVDSYTLWDFAATFRSSIGLSVTAAVMNVLDTDPPFTHKNSGLANGWDERFADPLGRTYSILFRYDL